MSALSRTLHILVLAIWTGSLFGLLVLKSQLSVLPSPHDAALIEVAVLAQLERWALVATPVLLVTLFAGWVPLQAPLRNRFLGILVCGALMFGSHQYVTSEQQVLLDSLGQRVEFLRPEATEAVLWARLTRNSRWLWGVETGLVVWLLIAATLPVRPKRRRLGIDL